MSEIKRNWIRFTSVSLFHSKLFFRFFSLLFASNFWLRFALVIFASKQSEIQVYFFAFFLFFRFFRFFAFFCFFLLYSLFSLFFAFFAFYRFFSLFPLFFALNFSLLFDLVILASKRTEGENFFASKEAKFNIFCIISLLNFVSCEKKTFLSIFSLNLRFTSILLLNFRLFYLRFRFIFLVFRIEVNYVKSGFIFASKQNEIFASISNFASEAKLSSHPSTDTGLMNRNMIF
jgi:hypothetical protein